ncbi:MAG: hypothetical protein U9R57_17690 [Thermodesulfobacteriota bacterium]|nr:hypothetical protein [Thermodesulfobacteriota bacterium]
MEQLVKIYAELVDKETGKPLAEGTLQAYLWDKDIVNDDFLAESDIGSSGEVSFIFNLEQVRSLDSPLEEEPDLYIVAMNPDDSAIKRIFTCRQSEVFKDTDFLSKDPVTREKNELTHDLGKVFL